MKVSHCSMRASRLAFIYILSRPGTITPSGLAPVFLSGSLPARLGRFAMPYGLQALIDGIFQVMPSGFRISQPFQKLSNLAAFERQ